jgi:hypothetical protein
VQRRPTWTMGMIVTESLGRWLPTGPMRRIVRVADSRREERAEQAAEAEVARAEEAAAVTSARREAKTATLRAEPAAGPGVTTLLVRMPDGSRQQRRFNLTDSVKAVYDFVDTLDSLTCVRYRYAVMLIAVSRAPSA